MWSKATRTERHLPRIPFWFRSDSYFTPEWAPFYSFLKAKWALFYSFSKAKWALFHFVFILFQKQNEHFFWFLFFLLFNFSLSFIFLFPIPGVLIFYSSSILGVFILFSLLSVCIYYFHYRFSLKVQNIAVSISRRKKIAHSFDIMDVYRVGKGSVPPWPGYFENGIRNRLEAS